MGFSFLNPLFLLGLSALALPFIVHFISKKRGIRKSFSAVRFVITSKADIARRSKIKDLILLFLRLCVITALVIVFSKPALLSVSPLGMKEDESIAIVVDNSFSMGYGDNFKKAKTEAGKIIGLLEDGSFGAVFPLISYDKDTGVGLTQDKEKLLKDLDDLRLSYSFTDNAARLEEVFSLLREAPLEKKRVVFITDLQKNGWDKEEFEREWLYLVDVGREKVPSNLAIESVDFKEEPEGIRFSLRVSNYSETPVENLLCTLELEGKELRGFLEIDPFSKKVKEFIFPKEKNSFENLAAGKAKISHDGLTLDDVRYFVLLRRNQPRVLIVDGDPREDVRLSETYYLGRAVEILSEVFSLKLSIKDNKSFLDEGIAGYDLIILANVGEVSPEKAEELKDFLSKGGGLVIFLGNRVRSELYSVVLKEIIPSDLGKTVEGNYSVTPFRENPITEGFGEKFSSVEVRRLFTLPLLEDSSTLALITSGGFPFLVERELGKGKVFVFTSSADLDWGNFPITPVFLPTLKSVFDKTLSPRFERRNFIIGEVVWLNLEGEKAKVVNPEGKEFEITEADPVFQETLIPGIYKIVLPTNIEYMFSVNLNTKESDLRKIPLNKILSKEEGSKEEDGLVRVFKGVWGYFLWGALGLLVLEVILRTVR